VAARVAVIGAGLAGLSAARLLAHRGIEVEVLEARDRVGGRTWSRRLDNGASIEMGAEFILPGNERVRELVAELGLGLWDKGMRYGQRDPRGGADVSEEELARAVGVVGAALAQDDSALAATVREFLDRLELEPGPRAAILARAEISSASSADEIPATDLIGVAHIGSEQSPSIAGGNQGLSLAMAESLGEAVRFRDPVVVVRATGDGVEIGTWSGHLVTADAAVVAVPASVVGRIAFEPRLPRAKADAMADVRYGHAAKLFVPLAQPAPPSAVMNVEERYWCWTATGEGDEPAPVVSCFAGSPGGLERLRVAEGPQRWLESLARLRPDLALEPEQAVLATWDDDLWVNAAYSLSPGSALTASLVEPVGPLVFAGEHTGGEFSGLMEGAIRSGERAAEQVIAMGGS
jgi:monoamine oxidase